MNVRTASKSGETARGKAGHLTEFLFGTRDFTEMLRAYELG
jgi:hypothetical protein